MYLIACRDAHGSGHITGGLPLPLLPSYIKVTNEILEVQGVLHSIIYLLWISDVLEQR